MAADSDAALVLTRHFKLDSELGPLYTGGKFLLSKDGKFAFALNSDKVTLFEVDSGVKITDVAEENEDVVTFTLSPNQQLLALSFKTFITRVY